MKSADVPYSDFNAIGSIMTFAKLTKENTAMLINSYFLALYIAIILIFNSSLETSIH